MAQQEAEDAEAIVEMDAEARVTAALEEAERAEAESAAAVAAAEEAQR